jgi:hypothetical protein
VVKAVGPDYTGYEGQNRVLRGSTDSTPVIHYFLRGQQCLTCDHSWESAELRRGELESLMRRADMLRERVEAYVEAADQAGERLADVLALLDNWDDSDWMTEELTNRLRSRLARLGHRSEDNGAPSKTTQLRPI